MTVVDVLTLYLHEADPLVLEVAVHVVTPLTVMVTVAPETGVPLLETLVVSVAVEPFDTLAPFAGVIRVTDNDGFPVTVYVALPLSPVLPVTVTV